MDTINLSTSSRTEFINITSDVASIVKKTGIKDGIVVVFNPHTTAGLTINENADPDVVGDMKMVFDKLVPWRDGYNHFEGNSAAHVKSSMMGASVTVIIEDGLLKLGTWQSIYFAEFDGPRTRKIWVKVIES